MYLLLHLLHNGIEPNGFSPTQLSGRPLLYLKSANTCNLKLENMGDVQDVGIGDMSSWRNFGSPSTQLSLCKKSVF